MNPFRISVFSLLVVALAPAFPQAARADVRRLDPAQTLPKPATPTWQYFGLGVAIDGPHIIVIAANDGPTGATYSALLYRRNLSDGRWVYRRTLVTRTGAFVRREVRMKAGIAAVQLGGQVSLFEYANGDYQLARIAAPINHPGGVAISNNRVLMGGDNCNYDGMVYEKGTNGIWNITGRLDDNAGACDTFGLNVELNYNYALLSTPYARGATAWRRTGPALDWVRAGTLAPPTPDVGATEQPYALQGNTAIANSGYAYVRTGTSTWTLQGRATPVDDDASYGTTYEVAFREGVLVTSESGAGWPYPRVYLETTPGQFEHVASLFTSNLSLDIDVSKKTVVSATRDFNGVGEVEVFNLPEPLRAPAPIVNDFEDRNASDFDLLSGQFQLATRGTNDVLAQNNSSGLAIALATPSDWANYQRIEAAFTPTFGGATSWVGLIVRYVDPNNYYYLAIRPNQTFGMYKRVNGADTLLREARYSNTSPGRMALQVDGADQIGVTINGEGFIVATDRSLSHGRAGLATWQARADFDDVHIAGTDGYGLYGREWGPFNDITDVGLTTEGGNWQVLTLDTYGLGLSQLDASGSALAYIGVPVANQELTARVNLDRFGSSPNGAWFGLLARYVDTNNHYYVTVRSTGQVQIRKKVAGVITVLASANYTAVPGQTFDLRFRVINDQLQLFLDEVLVASAHADDIARGRYGLATYRATATWDFLWVVQP